jgi:nucleoside-diphosphate-sugar epimerase
VARVVITGGCGNLGRLCAARLAGVGDDVVLLDSVRPEETPFPWSTDLPVHVVDLTDGPALESVLLDVAPDVVVHLAAQRVPSDHPDPARQCAPRFAGGSASEGDPTPAEAWSPHRAATRRDATFQSNVAGTYYLLDSAVRAGVRRVVAASSLCVLGAAFRISDRPFEVARLPIDEDHPLRPEDSYSLSKVMNEEMYAAYAQAYGLTAVAIRPPVILFEDIEATWAGRFRAEPAPPGPGGIDANLLMYVDARDVADAFVLAAQAPDIDGFEPCYVATGRMVASSPKRWLREHRPDLDHLTDELGDDDDLLSIDKAKRLLGYTPSHVWTGAAATPEAAGPADGTDAADAAGATAT